MHALRSKPATRNDVALVLAPALRHATGSSPFSVTLRVVHAGLNAGLAPETIRRWLVAHDTEQRCGTYTSTPRRFALVVSAARRRRAASSSSGAGELMLGAAAFVVVGHLLSPVSASRAAAREVRVTKRHVDATGAVSRHVELVERRGLSAARIATARRVFAVVGLDVVASLHDRGWDSALVSQRDLAARLGLSPSAVRSALVTCVQAGWLTRRSTAPGGAARYALNGWTFDKTGAVKVRLPAPAREAAVMRPSTVDAVADLAVGVDAVADLVVLAGHPLWGYTPTRAGDDLADSVSGSLRVPKLWLTALATEADVDPTQLGVTRRVAKRGVAAWTSLLAGHDLDEPLVAILNAAAETTGATDAAADAATRRAAEAAARTVEVHNDRERKAWAHATVVHLLAANPPPALDAANSVRRAWLTALRTAVDSTGADARLRRLVAKGLAKRLASTNVGYDSETARRVGARAAGVEDVGA